jgi:hypothetical protein
MSPTARDLLGRATLIAAALLTSAMQNPAAATELGVYVGPGCAGHERIANFQRFVGRPVERTVDALNQDSWPALKSSIEWVVGCWQDSGIKLTLSVPMLTHDGVGTLRDGANGTFDDVFTTVARTLVAHDAPDAIVRIGWEFNGDWQPWAAAKDPAGYIDYFRRIVSVMRDTPGQRFRFEWCPNLGRHDIDPTAAYPGDEYVDVLGLDVYDETWEPAPRDTRARWIWYLNQPFGLRWHREFALQHHKPISYPEWGTGKRPNGFGGGDNPVFIAGMADWFVKVHPLYQSYWDNRSPEFNTEISGGQFPLAAAEYVRQFGVSGRAGEAGSELSR